MLVRVILAFSVGPRPAGAYIVDDIEVRELADVVVVDHVGEGQRALLNVEAVVPQVGLDDDIVLELTHQLALELFPAHDAIKDDDDEEDLKAEPSIIIIQES